MSVSPPTLPRSQPSLPLQGWKHDDGGGFGLVLSYTLTLAQNHCETLQTGFSRQEKGYVWSCCVSHVTEWRRRIQCTRSGGQDEFISVCHLLKRLLEGNGALVLLLQMGNKPEVQPCRYDLYIFFLLMKYANIFSMFAGGRHVQHRLMVERWGILYYFRGQSLIFLWGNIKNRHINILGLQLNVMTTIGFQCLGTVCYLWQGRGVLELMPADTG